MTSTGHTPPHDPDNHYLLGHAPDELKRLDVQGGLYRDITRRAFIEAGIVEGMSVLDIGCGTGDVSLTAADVVGPTGSVLGIDRGEEALAVARDKAQALGLDGVRFEAHEIADFSHASPFDALVGRFVLMHQTDPAEVLRKAARSVRPGGIVVMIATYIDLILTGAHSEPHSPIYDSIVRWKSAVVRGAGADLRAGARLRATFETAGLANPRLRLESRLEGGPDSPYYEYLAESIRSLLPEAARLGLGGFTERDAETIADRLRDEVVAAQGSLVIWPVVVGTARV